MAPPLKIIGEQEEFLQEQFDIFRDHQVKHTTKDYWPSFFKTWQLQWLTEVELWGDDWGMKHAEAEDRRDKDGNLMPYSSPTSLPALLRKLYEDA